VMAYFPVPVDSLRREVIAADVVHQLLPDARMSCELGMGEWRIDAQMVLRTDGPDGRGRGRLDGRLPRAERAAWPE
jgi:hypothetical protein